MHLEEDSIPVATLFGTANNAGCPAAATPLVLIGKRAAVPFRAVGLGPAWGADTVLCSDKWLPAHADGADCGVGPVRVVLASGACVRHQWGVNRHGDHI